MITNNKVVSVSYTLHAAENNEPAKHIETADSSHPLTWLYGVGSMIPQFEENLKGKLVDDAFDFKIAAEHGYGLHYPEDIVNVPIAVFLNPEGKIDTEVIKVGTVLPMSDNQGNNMNGKVVEVATDHVRMDFNHPLAGHELHFTGKVLEVRDASKEELEHGHVHGPGGHHH